MSEPRFTNADFSNTYHVLSEYTSIPNTYLTSLFLKFLPDRKNYRKFGGAKGFDSTQIWAISNTDLSAQLKRSSSSTGSRHKEVWQAYSLVKLSGCSYQDTIYEHDGSLHRAGPAKSHELALTDELINFMLLVREKFQETSQPEFSEDEISCFLSDSTYGQREKVRRRKSKTKNTRWAARQYFREQGEELPNGLDVLDGEEKKSRYFKRPEAYYQKNFKKLKSRKARVELKSWKFSFITDINTYGLSEALSRLKDKMLKAGWKREEYIQGTLRIINKLKMKKFNLYLAVNFIYNKEYADLVDNVAEASPVEKLVVVPKSLNNIVIELGKANLPENLIQPSIKFWLDDRRNPLEKAEQAIARNALAQIFPLSSPQNSVQHSEESSPPTPPAGEPTSLDSPGLP